jgi:phenylacetate-CoA ligase
MRVSPVVGRANHLLKFKGTTLYPPAIYDVLDNTPHIENYVVEVNFDETGNDMVLIKIGMRAEKDNYLPLQTETDIIKELKDSFRAKIRVAPEIKICNANDLQKIILPDSSRKPVKFIDNRDLKIQILQER